MKSKFAADFQNTKLPTSTHDKLLTHLRENFSSFSMADGVNINHLSTLQKYVKRLASELGYKISDNPERFDREKLLTYSFLVLSNAQNSLMNQSPQLYRTNQLAVINFANAFGVPPAEDSDSLLNSIGLKYRIDNVQNIGNELTERLLCVPKILANFGLDKKDPKLLFNTENLCSAIRKKCEDTSFLDRVIELLELPSNSSETVVMKMIQKKMKDKDQSEQIQLLKHQNQQLHEKINELKSRTVNHEIIRKQNMIDAELEMAEQKKSELQLKNHALENEIYQLKQKVNELEKLNRMPSQHQERLKDVNDALKNQIESQRIELENNSKNMKDLYTLVNKQGQLLTLYDKALAEKSFSTATPTKSGRLRQIQPPVVEEKIFDIIADAIENAPPDIVDGILKITKSSKFTKTEKIKKIISFFIEEVRKQRQNIGSVKANKGECERLITAMHSQLRFLENLVSCDDDIQLLFEEPDEAKKSIQEQVMRIEQFLKQNAKGFVEDANIFDTLQLNVNPLELSKKLQSFLDRYPTIRTPEGDELFVMLRMSLAANGILRRFAITTRNQTEKQMNDIRVLTNEIEKVTAERERRTGYMLQQINEEVARREKAEQNLNKIRIMMKANNGKGSSNPALMEFLEKTDTMTDSDDYKQNLERQLSQALTELSKARAEIEAKELPVKDENLTVDLQHQIEKQLREINQLMTKINSQNNEIDQLNQQLASSQAQVDKLTKDLNDTKEKYMSRIKQLKSDINEKVAKETECSTRSEKQKCEHLKETIQKMRVNRKTLKATIAEKESKISLLDTSLKQLTEELLHQKDSYAKLDDLLRQAQTKQMSSEFEYKMLQQKVKTLEERAEKTIALHKMTSENETNTQVDIIRAELSEKHQNFLSKIFLEMRSYFDHAKSINDESVIVMLKDVKSKIKDLQSRKSALAKEINDIRIILGLNDRDNLLSYVSSLKKNEEANIQSIQKVSLKNAQVAKDWENWARTLYETSVPNSKPQATVATVKTQLERVLRSIDF